MASGDLNTFGDHLNYPRLESHHSHLLIMKLVLKRVFLGFVERRNSSESEKLSWNRSCCSYANGQSQLYVGTLVSRLLNSRVLFYVCSCDQAIVRCLFLEDILWNSYVYIVHPSSSGLLHQVIVHIADDRRYSSRLSQKFMFVPLPSPANFTTHISISNLYIYNLCLDPGANYIGSTTRSLQLLTVPGKNQLFRNGH